MSHGSASYDIIIGEQEGGTASELLMVGKQNHHLCFSMKKSNSSVCQDKALCEGVLYLLYSATVVYVSITWTSTIRYLKGWKLRVLLSFFSGSFCKIQHGACDRPADSYLTLSRKYGYNGPANINN